MLLSEEDFLHTLSRERKRSTRNGEPFLLMLIEMPESRGNDAGSWVSRVERALLLEMRETDLVGWYFHPSTVGIIFTTLNSADRAAIRAALKERTDRMLAQALKDGEHRNVRVSFHFFPEESEPGETSLRLNEKLYPDQADRNGCNVLDLAKRAVDIIGSLAFIALFSPLFLAIPLLIKSTSKGPVLFRQKRIGRFGREFEFLKFRTMQVNNDPAIHHRYVQKLILASDKSAEPEAESPPVFKIVHDPRVFPLGRFLRKTSLDELPQFFNVLRGEMSLVGPRPPIPYEVSYYRFWHRRRVIEAKPGITGLWQVEGRSRTTFDEMVRLDLRYVRRQSLWLDLLILLKTPRAALSGHGAY